MPQKTWKARNCSWYSKSLPLLRKAVSRHASYQPMCTTWWQLSHRRGTKSCITICQCLSWSPSPSEVLWDHCDLLDTCRTREQLLVVKRVRYCTFKLQRSWTPSSPSEGETLRHPTALLYASWWTLSLTRGAKSGLWLGVGFIMTFTTIIFYLN